MRSVGLGAWRQWPRWVRGTARIEGDEVVLDCGRAEEYVIHAAKDLPFDLAFLAPLSGRFGLELARVVPFVRRYGLLWHRPGGADDGELREPLDAWQEAAADIAFTIEWYRRLREAVRSSSVEPVRKLIESLSETVQFTASTDAEYLAQLSILLAEHMTLRLQECGVGLVAAAGLHIENDQLGRFLIAHHPPDLVSAAYVQLATLMVEKAVLKECPGCGRIFAPVSGKQVYHDTACANTTRSRKWRAQQAK